MKKYLIALFILAIILLISVHRKYQIIIIKCQNEMNEKDTFSGDYPTAGCDMAALKTGRPDGSLGSEREPTTLTYPEVVGFYGTGAQTAYTPNEMSAMRSQDGLIHAGWINNSSSGSGQTLTNSDRWNTNYNYQVGSSIQVVY